MLRSKELLLQNEKREKLLTEENTKVLTDMIVYLRGSNITELNQELVRADLIEMVLDAQERGDDIQTVFGGKYKEICDEIISAFPQKTRKQKLLDKLDIVFACMMALSVIAALRGLLGIAVKAHGAFMPISLGDLINTVLISAGVVVVMEYYMKTVFAAEEGEESDKRKFFKRWIVIAVLLMIPYLVGTFLTQEVMRLHVGVFFVISIVTLVIERRIAVAKEC